MAAVMQETPRSLEPQGRGHELLLTWGLHRRGGERTRSPLASVGWSEQLDRATDDEPPSVVAIDRLFSRLVRGNLEHSVHIAKVFYLAHPQLDYWQVAHRACRTEGFVRLTLRGIADLVDSEVRE